MRTARAIWKFLTHPLLSAAGNALSLGTLATLAVGAAVIIAGWASDQSVLLLTGVGLLLLNLICIGVVLLVHRKTKATVDVSDPSADPPALLPRVRPGDLPRRDTSQGGAEHQMPGGVYGGAAVGAAIRQHAAREEERAVLVAAEGEIGLAVEEAVELKGQLWDEWPSIISEGTELEEAISDWRLKTTEFIEAVLGSGHRAGFKTVYSGSDSMDRLEAEARFLGDLAKVITSEMIRVGEEQFLRAREARRANRSTKFIDYDSFHTSGAPPPATDLLAQIDALTKEGMGLVTELSESVEPERTKTGWKLSGGDAPAAWWETADGFFQRAQRLLAERRPGLLVDFENGFNGRLQTQREGQRAQDPLSDRRSTSDKMLDLANWERGGPRDVVEACLDGLTAARNRLET